MLSQYYHGFCSEDIDSLSLLLMYVQWEICEYKKNAMSHLEHFLWLVSQIFPPDLTLSSILNPCKIGKK